MRQRPTYEFTRSPRPHPATQLATAARTTAARDSWESEANRVAERVVTTPTPAGADGTREPEQTQTAAEDVSAGMSGGQPLDTTTRSFMEPRFGHDFSRVRIFADDRAARAAGDLGSQAYTVGRDIVFGAGRYQPGTGAGRDLIAHELTHVVQQRAAPPAAGAIATQVAPAGVAQHRHLTIQESVQQFTMKVDAADPQKVPSIVETGQFYWSKQMAELAQQDYRTILADPSWDPAESRPILDGMEAIVNAIWQYKPEKWKLIQHTIDLVNKSKHPSKNRLLALLSDHTGSLSGADIYQRLWQLRNQKEMAPELKAYKSLITFDKVHDAEASACGFTAGMAIQKFIGKGGFKSEDPDKTRDNKKLKGKSYSVASGVRRDAKRIPGTDFAIGDEVLYGGLSTAVKEMKEALDNGFVIHARVMSGWGVAGPPRLHSEHSIVIIGYDKEQFVFWDPDSGASRAYSSGFGYIYFDGKRLSTAAGEGAFPVDPGGNHADGEHRYQVLTMFIN